MSWPLPAQSPIQRRRAVLLTAVTAFVYLVLSAWMFAYSYGWNGRHFVYALDDPYIHLALSDGIAAGHYGINPGEASSPSSSLLWPFLLAPFAHFGWQNMVPLGLNLLAGMGVCFLIGAFVAQWPGSSGDEQNHPAADWALRVISCVALVFTANLVGLTFTGMEHTLQVLLAGAGAWGLLACLRGRPIPWWSLLAVAAGPSVRYENLGVVLAVAVALAGVRKRAQAAALLAAAVAPLLGFSLYLHHLGLPWVPTSVLVKSRVPGANGVGQRGLLLIGQALLSTFNEPQRLLLLVLFLTLAFAAARERERVRRFALAGAALAAGLHLLVGRFDWLHRYEVYIVFFCVLLVLQLVHERAPGLAGWYVLGLLGCSFLYIQAYHDTALAANQIYRQQYQTSRFLDDYYEGNVAVNDLGLVSYRARPGTYVLDLWGLASPQAAGERHKSTAWLDGIVRQHQVGLVAIYPLWFPPTPPDWSLLGELCLDEPPVVLGGSCVSYYATPATSLPDLRENWDDFVHTLPPGITVRTAGHLPAYR